VQVVARWVMIKTECGGEDEDTSVSSISGPSRTE
jgi:hypothetical protein